MLIVLALIKKYFSKLVLDYSFTYVILHTNQLNDLLIQHLLRIFHLLNHGL
jgi:hypothetical protein